MKRRFTLLLYYVGKPPRTACAEEDKVKDDDEAQLCSSLYMQLGMMSFVTVNMQTIEKNKVKQ